MPHEVEYQPYIPCFPCSERPFAYEEIEQSHRNSYLSCAVAVVLLSNLVWQPPALQRGGLPGHICNTGRQLDSKKPRNERH